MSRLGSGSGSRSGSRGNGGVVSETDVMQMEQRLSAMKANLAAEREARDAARKSNPTGSTWRSSRTDVPVSGTYVEQVLKKGPAAGGRAGPGKSSQRFQCKGPPASLVSAPSAAGAPSGRQLSVGGAAFGAQTLSASIWDGAGAAQQSSADAPAATEVYAWNPMAAVPREDDDFEALFAPEEEAPSSVSGGTGTCCGGSLMDGAYDEAAAARSFQEAVAAWRSGTGSGGGGGGGGGARPASGARPPSAEPTLAECIHAVSRELGLPADLTLAQAVAQANEQMGIEPRGTLSEQVKALLEATGVKVARRPVSTSSSQVGTDTPPLATQTAKLNYAERFLEQKRKDGLL